MKKNRVYGYCRISTVKQNIERQIANIKKEFPDAVITTEEYTGTTVDRPKWNKLCKQLKEGDTVVFDEVSRMSRNAEEGFKLYEELYNRGVNLIFIKERHIDTEVYKQTLRNGVEMTVTDVHVILEGVNKYLMILAKKQIEIAFQTAQAEVDFIHQRTSEGVRRAQAEGKQVGRLAGSKVETKKAKASKEVIRKHSKDFDGTLSDADVIKLTGLARNSYYKYKRELKAEINEQA
jgi:DNA invertase Pin-like site-specific DNA recombinase